MTLKIILSMLAIGLISLSIPPLAYAENSWDISISPYDSMDKKELFQPLELPIHSGDKVTWTNNDSTTHKIVSGISQYPDYAGEFFASDIIGPGEKYSISLDFKDFAGYYYFCEIHPWFTGKIFFEDRPDIFQSTKEITYEIQNSKTLTIKGIVEADLGTTNYEIVIFDSKNNLVFQKIDTFSADATFNVSTDISKPIWKNDEKYVLKLVYGVPSESTKMELKIPVKNTADEIKLKTCQESKTNKEVLVQGINLPKWYEGPLCWVENGFISQKEISESIDFFKKSLQN